MHVVIPFALSDDPACRAAAQALKLPALTQLASAWTVEPSVVAAPAMALAHEHVRAHALGLPRSTHYPWAALEAARQGLPSAQAWACVTPCHWQVGQGQVLMANPLALQLDDPTLERLRLAMQGFFAEDGIVLHAQTGAAHWLASGEVFRGLKTAPVARAVGRHLAPWLAPSRALQRLQNEMQMLLYTHPINDARSARGEPVVNSVWFSDSGALEARPAHLTWPAQWQCHDQLQGPALNNDWTAWQAAWQALDAQVLAPVLQASRNTPARLSLCSEDRVLTLTNAPRSLWQTIHHRFSPQGLHTLWNAL